MSETVNVHEAKTHFSRPLEKTHAGEEIVLAKAGIPYARMVPLKPTGKRTLGCLAGTLDDSFFDPLPDEELDAWEGK